MPVSEFLAAVDKVVFSIAVKSSDNILLGLVGSIILAEGKESLRYSSTVTKLAAGVIVLLPDRALITVTSRGNEGNSRPCNFFHILSNFISW